MPTSAPRYECDADLATYGPSGGLPNPEPGWICDGPTGDYDHLCEFSRFLNPFLCSGQPDSGTWVRTYSNSDPCAFLVEGTPCDCDNYIVDPPLDEWFLECVDPLTVIGGADPVSIWEWPGHPASASVWSCPDEAGGCEQRPHGTAPNYVCWCCPEGYEYDPVSGYCLDEPCPPGTCWCEPSGICVDCSDEPFCAEALNCFWNADLCRWSCDPEPSCDGNTYWDWTACECVPCPPGTCYCEADGACIPCPPQCASDPEVTSDGCVWNRSTCEWDCSCDPGESWQDCVTCACIPDCPPGYCWVDTYPGECIECEPPPCDAELDCCWDWQEGEWVCDDPAVVCGEERTWNEALCRCEGPGNGPWNHHDRYGRYSVSHAPKGIRYLRSDRPYPPFDLQVTINEDPAEYRAKHVRDWRGRVLMVFRKLGAIYERVSLDDGRTWGTPRLLWAEGNFPMITVPHPKTGAILRARRRSDEGHEGRVEATIQFPGDPSPSDAFEFMLTGGAYLTIDNATFQVSPEGTSVGRWLLAAYSGGDLSNWRSTDNARTWTPLDSSVSP